ncbi:MAG TPA: DUF6712 family protein [Parapedobacter sp.]|uniref:DUF6712 family protein n=1 Tax=Parapedobacter sp. TaxID=1958893 RepID=UPI002D04CBBE|nr:DUF6712 family protein [Parapedobacter sp.]HWK58107.1 DUF6712 family protein [Parapedobacter sp.]
MIISSSIELRNLTGSYYTNNDFTKVATDVELETEAIVRLVGQAIYDRAKAIYTPSTDGKVPGTIANDATDTNKALLKHLQLPIALGAAFKYYQANLVSHDDTSRKVKIDKGSESMAWQWMIDKDDEAHLRKTQRATDRLIAWLDKTDLEEWANSDEKKAAKKLFIPNTAAFQEHYPIDFSGLFYHTVRPFIADVQRNAIRQALGDDYQPLLNDFIAQSVPEAKEPLLSLTQQALALLTMAKALKRLSIQVLPRGVVQQFEAERHTQKGAQIPPSEDLRKYALYLERDAEDALDDIRKYRYENQPEYNPQDLAPHNDPCKKYART